jgi:RimJ/RimL family protein N-acetyltransferase
MAQDPTNLLLNDWRRALPTLTTRLVVLREPTREDVGALIDLLSVGDASRFGIDDPAIDEGVHALVDRVADDRTSGVSFTYVVTLATTEAIVGLAQVRRLDPTFEAAEWEMTLAPSARGTGVFVDAARLLGSFAFGSVGVYRLESRVIVQNGRANGALRKLGAVQEGILRKSLRRGDEYFDQVLWSVLKDDWGQHWVTTAARVH